LRFTIHMRGVHSWMRYRLFSVSGRLMAPASTKGGAVQVWSLLLLKSLWVRYLRDMYQVHGCFTSVDILSQQESSP
jgi:hypothetical protein